MPNDTYNPLSSRSVELVYDEVLQKWVPSGSTSTTAPTAIVTIPAYVSYDPVDAQFNAEKELIETGLNTLTGELTLTATEKAMGLRVNDTITISGIGSFLSGLYYITNIKRSISSSGYSQTVTVLRNGFGNSLKQASAPRYPIVPKAPAPLKIGDKVKIVGDNAVYSNFHDGVKVPAWVKQLTHTIDAVSADGLRVRLKEIWSWTYVKFIQKL